MCPFWCLLKSLLYLSKLGHCTDFQDQNPEKGWSSCYKNGLSFGVQSEQIQTLDTERSYKERKQKTKSRGNQSELLFKKNSTPAPLIFWLFILLLLGHFFKRHKKIGFDC